MCAVFIRKHSALQLLAVLLFLYLLFISVQSHADIYYVDNVLGSNTNTGERSKPLKDLRTAINILKAGDTLYIINNGLSKPYRKSIFPKTSGTHINVITVSGVKPDSKPTIVGSRDWSDGSAKGKIKWLKRSDNTLVLSGVVRPAALWLSSNDAWIRKGVNGLVRIKEVGSLEGIGAGQWVYLDNEKSLVYKLRSDEVLENLHIEAVMANTLLKINNQRYLNYKNVRFMFSAKTAVYIKNSFNIALNNIEVHHAMKNATSAKGGSDITIENCHIVDAQNNGIVFSGSKNNRLKNTIIKSCNISHVKNNDCISLHKDMKNDDVGSNHLIENNVLSSCSEQGIDITSGSNVTLLKNTTYGNGDSGILIGHGATNVLVKNHLSVDDGRYAGILVHKSTGVTIKDSCILNSIKHQLVFKDAKSVTAEGNVVYQGGNNKGSVIDVARKTQGIKFDNNIIISESSSDSLLFRYLGNNNPVNTRTDFTNNKWSSTNSKRNRKFYTPEHGKQSFTKLNEHYDSKIMDKYYIGLQFENVKPILAKNNCDLKQVPGQYMRW